ncbi:MAG: hypothetical protein NTX46_05955 [Chloroflexi bacterium]|nr:hypothetical protein [Chloroflexota bacterium]
MTDGLLWMVDFNQNQTVPLPQTDWQPASVCTIMITMSALLILLIITILFVIGSVLAFLWMFSQKQIGNPVKSDGEPMPPAKPAKIHGFRWSYALLPLAILLISIIIAVYFYGKLPDEVVYNFKPDEWLSRNTVMLWALIPQALLALLAIVIAWGTARLNALFKQIETSGIKIDTILMIMSNMVAIPQLILGFAMLNIFSYNAFQTRISSLWAFVLAIIVMGIVFLDIFFIRTIRKVWGASK